MKKLTPLLAAVIIFCICAFFLAQSFLAFFVKRTFEKTFPNSQVSLRSCVIFPPGEILFSDIRINSKKAYDFQVKSLKIRYSLISLAKRVIPEVEVKGVRVNLEMGNKNIGEFVKYLKLEGESVFLVDLIKLEDVQFKLSSKDIKLAGKLSLAASLLRQVVEEIDLKVSSFESGDFQASQIFLVAKQGSAQGDFSLLEAKFGKLKIFRIKSPVSLQGKKLAFSEISADTLDGKITGEFDLDLAEDPVYSLKFDAGEMTLEAVVRDFDLEEKFKMSGKFFGSAQLQAKGAQISGLSGDFFIVEPGGTLLIYDQKMLEDMSKNIPKDSQTTQEMIVESLKDYRYNKGQMNLSLKGQDIFLDMRFDGAQGKREFHINLLQGK